MRINIVGQFGFSNTGDEGILQAIIDSLGFEHEIIISTSLPYNMLNEYHHKNPTATEVRSIEDTRTDYDFLLYGGGKVDWGFAWGQFIRAFQKQIPTMAYGISIKPDNILPIYQLLKHFIKNLDVVTCRELYTFDCLKSLTNWQEFVNYWQLMNNMITRNTEEEEEEQEKIKLAMCPAINLREEKTACVEGATVVCPRFEDFDEYGISRNEPQINWLVEQCKQFSDEKIVLLPFYPQDTAKQQRDIYLCNEINKRLGGGCIIVDNDGFSPRKMKYIISKSRRVISGGRYHPVIWAIAHDIPYYISPTCSGIAGGKIEALKKMTQTYSRTELLELEKINKKTFNSVVEKWSK